MKILILLAIAVVGFVLWKKFKAPKKTTSTSGLGGGVGGSGETDTSTRRRGFSESEGHSDLV